MNKTTATALFSLLLIIQSVSALGGGCDANAGNDTSLCADNSITLMADPINPLEIGLWSLISGSGTFVDPTSNVTDIVGLAEGDNILQWEVAEVVSDISFSLDFTGFLSYVSVPHDPELDGGSEFTMEAWVNLDNPAANQKIMGKTTVAFNGGYLLGVQGGMINPEIWDNTGTNYTFSAGSIPAATWTHLAVSWESGVEMIAYINGIEVMSIPASANPIGSNFNDLILGTAPWDVFFFGMDGKLDEVRIWDTVVDSMTIATWKDLSASPAHPEYGSLVSYYSMETGFGFTAFDQKEDHDGAINGASWSTDNAPVIGSPDTVCFSVDTVVITVNPLPDVSFSVSDSVCENDDLINLSGMPSGGNFSGPGISGTSFDPSLAGTGTHQIIYSITDANGCFNADTNLVVVNAKPPTPTISMLGDDTLSCDITGDTYEWQVNGLSVGLNTQQIVPLSNGTYTVSVIIDGCASDFSAPFDFFIIGIDEPSAIISDILLFPNPAADVLDIRLIGPNTLFTDLIIYDNQGIQIVSSKMNQSSNQIQIDDLAPGIYWLSIKTANGRISKPFVKE